MNNASYAFSNTLNLALRLRRLVSSSAASASMGLQVISLALATPPQVQMGCSGGQVQRCAQRRNLFLTSRSSGLWKVMTQSRPPEARQSKMASGPSFRASARS